MTQKQFKNKKKLYNQLSGRKKSQLSHVDNKLTVQLLIIVIDYQPTKIQ